MSSKAVPAELSLMEAVLESGTRGTHREALIRAANLSKTSFYRVIQPLLKKGILQEKSGYYTFPLGHPHNYAFKLWRDQARVLRTEDPLRSELLALVETLQEEFKSNFLALWLVGSAAHLTMGEESDLDLVLVVRRSQEYEPQGSRAIQLTTWTEKDFRELYRMGDNFVRTALQYGLVLADRGFAQEFYAQTMPEPSLKAFREREELLQQGDRRLSFFLREKAMVEARQILSGLAVATGRLMLERLGELPAGKRDLVRRAEFYFGPKFAELLQACLSREAEDSREVLQWNAQLQRWYQTFLPQADYLEGLVRGLSSSGQEFEVAAAKMLALVFPEGLSLPIEVKSCKGEVALEQLRRGFANDSLLILNALSEVPPTQRPDLSAEVYETAGQAGVIVWDSRQLLQYHNRVLLEETRPALALALTRPRRRKTGKASALGT